MTMGKPFVSLHRAGKRSVTYPCRLTYGRNQEQRDVPAEGVFLCRAEACMMADDEEDYIPEEFEDSSLLYGGGRQTRQVETDVLDGSVDVDEGLVDLSSYSGDAPVVIAHVDLDGDEVLRPHPPLFAEVMQDWRLVLPITRSAWSLTTRRKKKRMKWCALVARSA